MNNTILIQLLTALPIFQQLDAEELRILAFIGKRREHATNAILCAVDGLSHDAILLSAGRIIIQYEAAHKPDIVARRGMMVNELSLFASKQYSHRVMALEHITTYHFSQKDFMHLIEEFPAIGHKVQNNIALRVGKLAVLAN